MAGDILQIFDSIHCQVSFDLWIICRNHIKIHIQFRSLLLWPIEKLRLLHQRTNNVHGNPLDTGGAGTSFYLVFKESSGSNDSLKDVLPHVSINSRQWVIQQVNI